MLTSFLDGPEWYVGPDVEKWTEKNEVRGCTQSHRVHGKTGKRMRILASFLHRGKKFQKIEKIFSKKIPDRLNDKSGRIDHEREKVEDIYECIVDTEGTVLGRRPFSDYWPSAFYKLKETGCSACVKFRRGDQNDGKKKTSQKPSVEAGWIQD